MKILIALHKPYAVPKEAIYLPIQVGADLPDRQLLVNTIADNTGRNISKENGHYNELTALYWAKYNLADEDIIGLVHYRRYFGRKASHNLADILSEDEIRQTLKTVDVILPKARNYFIENQQDHYLHAHRGEPYFALEKVLTDHYPDYLPAFSKLAKTTRAHLFNMSIMKQVDFQAYTTFLFDVLALVAEQIDLVNYRGQEQRALGFLAERLMDVWLVTNQKSFKEFPLVTTEKTNWLDKGSQFLLRKFGYKQGSRTHF
nr:DUF4422 domain-containing protein [Weissella oryzae]